jgi:hypothetical protein
MLTADAAAFTLLSRCQYSNSVSAVRLACADMTFSITLCSAHSQGNALAWQVSTACACSLSWH